MENIGAAEPLPGEIVPEQFTEQVELERHFPEHQMVGHGVRSTSRCSRSFDPQCVGPHRSSYESITEWRPEDGGEDSDFSAVMNLVTCAIGSGIVYLPYAAGECGLILGTLLHFIFFCKTLDVETMNVDIHHMIRFDFSSSIL